jgi:phage-related protein
MYTKYPHGHLLVVILSGKVTIDEIKMLASDIDQLAAEKEEIFVLALMQSATQFPQNIAQIAKAFQLVNAATKKITRLYGIRYNAIVSYLSHIITQVLRIGTNTVEAGSLEELLSLIEREAELFPSLKASISDLESIKAEIQRVQSSVL